MIGMNYDTNEQTLKEIRRLRRGCELAYIFMLLIFAVFCAALYGGVKKRQAQQAQQTDSWNVVRTAMDSFEYDKAYGVAQRIVAKYPSNHYGHAYLGSIAVAAARFQDAERHYIRACELLPTEDNEKMLEAIRKRLARTATSQQAAK